MKTIVVGVDFSPVTASLCRSAAILARRLRARVVLVHGVEFRPLPDETGLMIEYAAVLAAGAERTAHQRLARLARRLQATGLRVEPVCRQAMAADLILDEATRRRADLIALGSHGHTALFDLFAGSTAHRVLRRASCPVLVVPARPAPDRRRQKMHSPSQRARSRS
jgi:nucleotide-binding universal stress UspA family protein